MNQTGEGLAADLHRGLNPGSRRLGKLLWSGQAMAVFTGAAPAFVLAFGRRRIEGGVPPHATIKMNTAKPSPGQSGKEAIARQLETPAPAPVVIVAPTGRLVWFTLGLTTAVSAAAVWVLVVMSRA